MSKRAICCMIWGWIFICIDAGKWPFYDALNDGVGFLLIAIGLCFIKEKNQSLWLALFLSFFLFPFASVVSLLKAFSDPSWTIVLLRCVPPILSLPIGIILANYACNYGAGKGAGQVKRTGKNAQKQKKMILCYIIAQLADISCILYFLPIRTSVLVDHFNRVSPFSFLPVFVYLITMTMFLLELKSAKG